MGFHPALRSTLIKAVSHLNTPQMQGLIGSSFEDSQLFQGSGSVRIAWKNQAKHWISKLRTITEQW
jgi:hypothetical protein